MPSFRIENIVYELTGACNQCCRFCYNHWRKEGAAIPAPDPRQARKTLQKLLSQARVGTISFSGGEPLLLPNVHDLVFYARYRGCRVNVLTNGILLTPEGLENISKSEALWEELRRRGYTQSQIDQISGGNVMAVYERLITCSK